MCDSCKNFVTPHCHPASLDSGSTPEAFVAREKELGTNTLTVTDHGTLAACRQVYALAKKNKMIPILGLEGYFRDDHCDILSDGGIEKDEQNTYSEYNKYYHITMHFRTQKAYETGVRILSKADERAERHGSERKALFTWSQLEEIGAEDTTFMSSCLVGMVQRHLLADRPDLAIKYYEKLRSCVKPGNFYVELFPHKCDKNWVKAAFVQLEGEEKPRRFWFGKNLRVEINGQSTDLSAEELSKRFVRYEGRQPTIKLYAVKNMRKWEEEAPKLVLNAWVVEDFIQNECRPWAENGDVQLGTNVFLRMLARKYGDPIVVSDDSHFAHPEDKVVQDIRLLSSGQDTWRFYGSYHRKSSSEALDYFKSEMGISEAEFHGWVENSHNWAQSFKDFKFVDRKTLPVKFYPTETMAHTISLIKKHGRMNWRDPEMMDRLHTELNMLHDNGVIDLLPYFFVLEEGVSYCLERGRYTGVGRGSAAGLILSYLLGITHVNPLKYGLSWERFLTEDRIKGGKLPDIDQDLADRELIINPDTGWLKQRFGDHYAQVSTDTMLRLKSSIKDVARVIDGAVSPEIEALTKRMPIPPQGITDKDFVFGYEDSSGSHVAGISEVDPSLREYIERWPKHWAIVQKCLGVTRNKSRHACAYVIANEPISNFIPTVDISGHRCTQYTAAWVEEAGGLKMDWLGLNTLTDIEACVKLIHETHAGPSTDLVINGIKVPAIYAVPHPKTGEPLNIWDLPDEPMVFKSICAGDTATVFQFNTPAARQWLTKEFWNDGEFSLKSVEDISAFTALDRPGPLDATVTNGAVERNMLEEYAARARGEEPIGNNAILDKMFPETYGIVVYQEQLQKAFQVIGKTTGTQADNFRIHISKKKMSEVMKDKAVFMPGAIESVGEAEAQRLWDMMETFGQYGFNKSHAVCYAYTGYVCAWLKYNYPLHWWTAVLRNAERNEINDTFWQHCGHLIDPPDLSKSGATYEIKDGRIRAPLTLLSGIGPTAHAELMTGAPYTSLEDFLGKLWKRRVDNGTPGKKKVKGQEIDVIKPARSALNKTIMTKLIVSGAADSFFEPNQGTYDKLAKFNEVKAQIEGKKKVDKVDPKFMSLSPIQRFLMKKEILPGFSEPMVKMAATKCDKLEEMAPGKWMYDAERAFKDEKKVLVVNGNQLRNLELETEIWSPIRVAVVGYIFNTERFWNGKAVRVGFEVDGEKFEFVKWPGRDKTKPASLPEGVDKSLSILLLTRFNGSKPFSVDDIELVENVEGFDSEESAEESK